MKLLKFVYKSLFQLVSLLFLLVFALGVLNIYFSDRNNYCVMTYMYEYPQFVRISIPENKFYPQYGLYAYSEGRLTERARNMWFDGVPVLYLPGNSGSHMQARSLASVALRKAISHGGDYHFDFFTVSFNEELSGLYGGVLQEQTDFVAACIRGVLNLYKANKYTKAVPTSVILIGHSMGGLIAKRLLAYPETIHTTRIAITLASPLEAPVINFDYAMNNYYKMIDGEWSAYIRSNPGVKDHKVLLSFGNGPRDILMPSYLTSSKDSDINALVTSIPGAWVSPDHVSIVWCKQLVMTINRFLFSIVDRNTDQVVGDKTFIIKKATQYFQANRSMTLGPNMKRSEVNMVPDGFWYEDNRRIYQISRPDVDKMTYLMIRLVTFPQNRFVAVESVNLQDKDWIFGCNAMYTYGSHRYCKQATSITELSRWTGSATGFGKRKLSTIHLHDIMEKHPDWSHVVVKLSPTKRPIKLNVDINDLASRQLTVSLPLLPFTSTVIIQETQPSSLYYELVLLDLSLVHQAYYLEVRPVGGVCGEYHVSAELHVPWAEGHDYYHYFTRTKQTPMKLRLYKSNPNVTAGLDAEQHVKLTLLLDPHCTFRISISQSWYHRLAQMVRYYTPVLFPYTAAILLLAARSNLKQLAADGTCMSIHTALMSEGVKPYYVLVFSRLMMVALGSVPILATLMENASSSNVEMGLVSRSLVALPLYLVALGGLHAGVAGLQAVMVASNQLANRLLFRILWRGGSTGMGERVASGLRKVPILVSVGLVGGVALSCGAAALTAGAAYYAFMISNMYEEYLEDYVYKLMAKIGSKICMFFKRKSNVKQENTENNLTSSPPAETQNETLKAIEEKQEQNADTEDNNKATKEVDKGPSTSNVVVIKEKNEVEPVNDKNILKEKDSEEIVGKKSRRKKRSNKTDEELNNELSNLNYHMMMFLLWLIVWFINLPVLLTWARNFKYSMVLKYDTSYYTGYIMSICSIFVWQTDGPRKKLKYYQAISDLLFIVAVLLITLGPTTLTVVNNGVTVLFTMLTLQQVFDTETDEQKKDDNNDNVEDQKQPGENASKPSENASKPSEDASKPSENASKPSEDASKPSENASKPSENASKPSENASKPSEDASKPSEDASKPRENVSTGDENDDDDDKKDDENCECSETRIYNVIKTIKEKLNFSEDNL